MKAHEKEFEEIRMFHLCTLDSDAGSLGIIKGTTAEELNAALRQAVEQCLNADEGTVFLPEIDWDYWRRRHTEEITVTYSEDGHTVNQTIEMTYTWEA